jgi:hypothetical protein
MEELWCKGESRRKQLLGGPPTLPPGGTVVVQYCGPAQLLRRREVRPGIRDKISDHDCQRWVSPLAFA